ncbi:unnamed protein product [Diabrotica balteata]|uniref:Mitotic checkpoint serine/threonine-protein kinase BUB1 n=1 Tax=Diabrotica balteata TaxID=107213 RepID=A0A9N9T3X8_DIABA|nr:unnamed protein product [Diabrotica balteata]
MDFEYSKENILPLLRGRNVHQLNMALQAQTNRDCQQELLQQKEQWEELIRTYTGEDPLENYYKYISWIEQTYPKHGHEGNLVPLLEHCLTKFETDRQYANDRRFCKLWIKYFDLQPKPLEFYHMMKAKGLCTGCADFYKAWAYYHEAAGDFIAANKVFEEGKRNLAQPFDELENAHQNLVIAAGQHLLFGPNENHLIEKRQALTSLHTYRSGRVSSVRVPSSNSVVTVPSNSSSSSRSNMVVHIHEDPSGDGAAALPEAPPISIIAAVKRQEIPKENTLKAGPWTNMVPVKKRVIGGCDGSIAAGFTVHEDVMEVSKGIRLPKNYPQTCQEDYSEWVISICYPEPPNPSCIPMYPKHRVYGEPNTEYSIEELRSSRYVVKPRISELIDDEVEFIEEILPERIDAHEIDIPQQPMHDQHMLLQPQVHNISQNHPQVNNSPASVLRNSFSTDRSTSHVRNLNPSLGGNHSSMNRMQSPMGNIQSPMGNIQSPMGNIQSPMGNIQSPMGNIQSSMGNMQSPMGNVHSPMGNIHSPMGNVQSSMGRLQSTMGNTQSPIGNVHVQSPIGSMQSPMGNVQSHMGNLQSPAGSVESPAGASPFLVWPTTNLDLWQSQQNTAVAPFGIFEQSLEENQLRGSAMKTALKDLNADELAETGSRGGMDVAVTAQATDSAKRIPAFSDNSSSSAEDVYIRDVQGEDDFVNTEVFSFNLTAMKVSTPQKRDRVLSTILEESKGSSSNSSSNIKSSHFTNTNKTGMISEEHNSYLAQNLMANAALRSSLLANLMDMPAPTQPVPIHNDVESEPIDQMMQSSPIEESPIRTIPAPANVAPLEFIPSDPFKSSLINQLLEKVAFPGPHTYGYKLVQAIPRLCVKKEAVFIGRERYVLEKQLGKGTFGTVYKAIDLGTSSPVAMKYQKPANKWEYYICRELQSRLANHPLRDRFMDIPLAYFGDQASLIISEYIPGGSLLDLANMYKQKSAKPMKECLVIYLCIQMLQIIQAMHQVQIIHADIKPDNFLVFVTIDNTVGLQLIDFGCSIDMSLFPPNATFKRPVTTEDFVCCEMLDGRPWNYHTDLFCVAATAHVLLFDTYIKLQKRDNIWSIQHRFPRYLKVDLWNMFFSSLLNQQTGPADAASLILMLEETLETLNKDTSSALPSQMRYIVNLLKNR